MIEVRHKSGTFLLDENDITYVAFEDLEISFPKQPLQYKYCVTAITHAGIDVVVYKGNKKDKASEAYYRLRRAVSPESKVFAYIECEDFEVGVCYD